MLLRELFNITNGIATTGLDVSDTQTPEHDLPLFRPSQSFEKVVAGYVKHTQAPSSLIFPVETLFVSTNGQGSHTYAYVSGCEFIPNSDITVLTPKLEMALNTKIYYALCITQNRWLFSYGRKPKGERLMNISLPDTAPQWVSNAKVKDKVFDIEGGETIRLENKGLVKVSEIFDVIYGTNLALNALTKVAKHDSDGINFVSRTSRNNGISARVRKIKNIEPIPAGILTVAAGGSVLETFVQTQPFYSGRDIYCLIPKRDMNLSEKLFYSFCIRANKYRYTYNRQANRTLREIQIPANLPEWAKAHDLESRIDSIM